ncbi:DUF2508 family protein [Paenibacillus physcomitrellae]|uniref:DUF2508 family protein n=1 Tax=Paenibacillus physcomitrellae TaxID=1619311 RepID=A0ABQ1GYI6_9BACL|nr:DUF2508 family protein [Paenibacillus physcomitrellae]GGA52848.1 hypothetical protein GCM10010917_42570 [Paenibacillus physcomitrellae]
MKWGSLFSNAGDRKQQRLDMEERERVYYEVLKAHKEWQRAHWAFQSAVGQDEVDVAIYTLEAAERRYQIQLKEAKKLEIHLGQHIYPRQTNPQMVRRLGS